ncbi:NADH ubiquinone oxidoreductase, 20 kDa subunit [Plesiocystis pacifica SIR-1]|uniref:NADH ubiquinone oxidoreductase, 20 kDa subunit n=1 Tax=Plesiocystis pacifica SIR-1 TaxID=391625 RepID=A6FYA5_9BACT|nr:oxidoreductase [Plesiocystis pacifica]EDM81484.1 NADH ubiquinone oxidoreductase, 20 kDa subunit [Plesiocystis pacifica SIR-1]
MAARPRLGVFKLASCDGCQLTLLDLEDELLAIAAAVDIVHFPEASSDMDPHGRFDLTLVEGSVSTPAQLDELRAIRAQSRTLVAIGACATAGGVQALRNFADHREYVRAVYATPAYIETLAQVTPIAAHVRVDFELRGCPIDKGQLLELISATLVGRRPDIADESVCMACKRAGQVCVTVAHGQPCLGPVTHAGCGALCPRFSRGCFGCYGPRERANTEALADHMQAEGVSAASLVRRFRLFTGWSEAFRAESERHDD